MAQMSAVFAELERALIAQRTTDALAELRARGQVYGAMPYGFRRDGDCLVAEAGEQVVLVRVRKLRAKGKSYGRIAELLNRSCVPAKRGGRWHAMSVRSVLLTSSRVGRVNAEVVL